MRAKRAGCLISLSSCNAVCPATGQVPFRSEPGRPNEEPAQRYWDVHKDGACAQCQCITPGPGTFSARRDREVLQGRPDPRALGEEGRGRTATCCGATCRTRCWLR